jgi:hypothetical protein
MPLASGDKIQAFLDHSGNCEPYLLGHADRARGLPIIGIRKPLAVLREH